MNGIRILAALLVLALLAPCASAAPPEREGKAFCLMERSTGTILEAQNEHEPLPPASVTKIMTLLLVMEAVDAGQLGWNDPVTASEAAAAKGGSQIYLKAGEVMTVEDLVKSVAVSSANDCACALAEHLAGSEAAFAEKMNRRAAELGMADTHFVNCTGLDDSPEAQNHRTSAHDIALMSRELLEKHPDIKKFTTIWMDSVRNGSFGLSNTNKLVRFYPGCTGLKTGFTSGAGYCLSASAERDGMELIAVVLGCESSKGRFSACRSLLEEGFAEFSLYTPELPPLSPIPVRLGKSAEILPVPREIPGILLRKSEKSGVRTELSLLPGCTAPVRKGETLGELTVRSGDAVLARIALTAPEEIPRLGFGDLFAMLLRQMAAVR